MLGILLKMFTFLLVYFVSSTRCFFCVNFDKRNIFEIFHTFILNCSKITTNVSIFQRPFLKFRQGRVNEQVQHGTKL